MTIKELKQRLNEFDNDDKLFIDAEKIMVYEFKKDWYSFIRFEDSAYIEQLTHEERLKYLQMALGIASNFRTFDFKTLDMIVSISDLIAIKKEQTCLKSICEIKKEVEKRANNSLP
jgi:hypothetical protein